MGKAIAVISGKGGVGKTTVSANTALSLSRLGQGVTVVDCDLSNSNLGLQLGFFQFPLGLSDSIERSVDVSKATYAHPSGIKVVPSTISVSTKTKVPTHRRLRRILSNIDDIAIIDSPPGIGRDVKSIIKASDFVMVVTNPEIPAVTDALKAIETSRSLGKNPLGVVINRTGDKYELRTSEVENICGLGTIGRVPEDRAIKKSIFNRNPVVFDSPFASSSLAFMELASSLSGIGYKRPRMAKARRLFRR